MRLTPLITADAIAARVAELGAQIAHDYRDRPPLVVGVLDGAFVFLADLCRRIDLPIECDFVAVRSYGDRTESGGEPSLARDLVRDVADRHVLLVEDIVDTGLTADFLLRLLSARGTKSLAICSLLRKEGRALRDVPVQYVGFTIPDRFVVGYGLDFAGRFRGLPHLAILEDE
jgi:hypoxanthine phosphoribosyltransferase